MNDLAKFSLEKLEASDSYKMDPYEQITSTARPTWGIGYWLGYGGIALFVLIFGVFGSAVELQSSVFAIGQLEVERDHRRVQHDAHGVVTEIHVKEGQFVEKDQLLLTLDSTRISAQHEAYHRRLMSLEFKRASLISQRDSLQAFTPTPELLAYKDRPDYANLEREQRALFDAIMREFVGQSEILLSQFERMETSIKGFDLQLEALAEQERLIKEEMKGVEELLAKGLERRPRLLALQRRLADIKGSQGQVANRIVEVGQARDGIQLQLIQLEERADRRIRSDLDSVELELSLQKERGDILDLDIRNLEVRSPNSGRVFGLRVNTIGGVVSPGQVLMEIVPTEDRLIVVGKIKAKDIDQLRTGDDLTERLIQVRVTAFSQRFTKPILADFISVSDDVVPEPGGGRSGYEVRVALKEESVKLILGEKELVAGMPAMILIGAGTNTLASYLLEPMFMAFSMAMREP